MNNTSKIEVTRMLLFNNNAELNKLQHLEAILEKKIDSFISSCSKTIPEFESEIAAIYQPTQNSCTEAINDMKQNVQTIVKALKSKADVLKHKKMTEIRDFDKFKCEMVVIQENIMNLKRTSKLQLNKLKQLEHEIVDELENYYYVKIPEWSEQFYLSSLIPPHIKSKHTTQQPKEIKQFFEFVHQSGGHENGWRSDDHLLFLKLRSKYKNIKDLAANLHEILPDISIEEITQHHEWYKKYLQLRSKKKEAINKWKDNKKHVKICDNYESPKTIRNMNADTAIFKEKLLQWKVESANNVPLNLHSPHAEKAEKLLIDQEIEKQKIRENDEKGRAKRQRQIEIKKLVNEWKESKVIFEQSEKQHQRIYEEMEKKKRAANANKLIRQFQSMDELHILKMRQVHKKNTNEPRKRIQSGPAVSRDPKRLVQPTVQWAQRVRADKEPFKGPLPLFAMPKLAVPEWRKTIL